MRSGFRVSALCVFPVLVAIPVARSEIESDLPKASCVAAFTLSCGSSDNWRNDGKGSTDVVASYACLPFNYSGSEYTYVFRPAADSHVQVDLSGLSADLDAIILRDLGAGCSSGNCISHNVRGGTASEQIRFGAVGGHRYYVVVDGLKGQNSSSYNIQLTCDGATFADVPSDHWAFLSIQALYNAGVTSGCSASPRLFCPGGLVSRDQMAVFLERAVRGRYFSPAPPVGTFSDVPLSYWAAGWIERLYIDGITAGCATNPLRYCPTGHVTRAEMAVFLLRAKHGASYVPPSATGIFSDVPVSHWAAPWIEELYQEGITAGCGTNPLRYCPGSSVTRAEMGVFLLRTFNLPLP